MGVSEANIPDSPAPHRRRPRYRGKNPRRFEEKYKEHGPRCRDHRQSAGVRQNARPARTGPIMVAEILAASPPAGRNRGGLHPRLWRACAAKCWPGSSPAADCWAWMPTRSNCPKPRPASGPGLRRNAFTAHRSNFAGLPRVLAQAEPRRRGHHPGRLGVSSMQIDNPARGFSVKFDGPLDMRMNPQRGQPASALLEKIRPEALTEMLQDFADEPNAAPLAAALAGRSFATTGRWPKPSAPRCRAWAARTPISRCAGCFRRCASR